MNLLFGNAVFHVGENVTVRKGIKWDLANKTDVIVADTKHPETPLAMVNIFTKVMVFKDLVDADLVNEHDPSCRTKVGLFNELKSVYGDFDERELITIVKFRM